MTLMQVFKKLIFQDLLEELKQMGIFPPRPYKAGMGITFHFFLIFLKNRMDTHRKITSQN